MRALVFTKGDRKVPSSNFRVWILTDYLKREYSWDFDFFHGISYPFWGALRKRFTILGDIVSHVRKNKYNLIFVHKVHFPLDIAIAIFLIKKLKHIPVIYDIDDPQWKNSRAQDFIISRIADRIFCSSLPFMEHYKVINPSVVYIPTVLDDERYAAFKTSYSDKATYIVGWVGDGMGHFKFNNFHIIKPVLEELAREGIKIVFRIVGTKGYKPLENFIRSDAYQTDLISQVPFEEVPKQIQSFDIGVAPIQDIEWFRINATAKGVEYMACGVPVIASPVGAYNDLVKDGENGYLAKTTQDWVETIKKLCADANLRKRIGEAGLRTVREGYSYMGILPTVKKEFEKLAYGD